MRLTAQLRCDLRLQWRNGFYLAAGLVAAASVIIIQWVPPEALDLLLPVVILQNVMVNSFYFVAGQILLENGEGTRAAQVITPLRRGEYLASKVVTLGFVSLVESLVISIAGQGVGISLLPLCIGIGIGSALFTLFGVALVCPYRSINEFIMPSVLYTTLLAIPILGWFGFGAPILYDWHPIQGPLNLITSRSEPLSVGRFVYAATWPLLWIWPLYLWSRRSLARGLVT